MPKRITSYKELACARACVREGQVLMKAAPSAVVVHDVIGNCVMSSNQAYFTKLVVCRINDFPPTINNKLFLSLLPRTSPSPSLLYALFNLHHTPFSIQRLFTDKQTDRQTDIQTDGWTDERTHIIKYKCNIINLRNFNPCESSRCYNNV